MTDYFYAKDLRDKNKMKEVPACPGYYKWWAKEEELNQLLYKLDLEKGVALPCIEKNVFDGETRYCIYVGITGKKTLRVRFSQHIKRNTEGSTLRRSLAALFGKNDKDEEAANSFIDKLIVEYFSLDDLQPSDEANNVTHKIEQQCLSQNLYLLNIQENHHPLAPVAKLKDYRKKAKEAANK